MYLLVHLSFNRDINENKKVTQETVIQEWRHAGNGKFLIHTEYIDYWPFWFVSLSERIKRCV